MADRAIINAFMAGLVDRLGGQDAVAAILSARHRVDVSKGTISKRLSGQLDWPAVDIYVLEDAAGDPCVSQWRALRLPGAEDRLTLLDHLSAASREHGEAMAEGLAFASGRGDRTRALKELHEAANAAAAAIAHIEATS